MTSTIASVWELLERDAEQQAGERLYRALGESAIGLRAGYLPQQRILELLIEVPSDWSGASIVPDWKGMQHEVLPLALPPRKTAHHLRLFLVSMEHRAVFMTLCQDLVTVLEGITDGDLRVREIERCLLRWRRFFERCGSDGLTIEMQQGLFAELTWLKRLLEIDIEPLKAVSCWKGCEQNFHDFDLDGHVVEVKSTRTKEPRTIIVSNERQLDDQGLQSLYLYVLSIQEVAYGGQMLPEQVDAVRAALINIPAALAVFNNSLVSAGYLDIHAERYTRHLFIKAEELYRVSPGFPRIIRVPPGVGNLRYGVQLGACQSFREELKEYTINLVEQTREQ